MTNTNPRLAAVKEQMDELRRSYAAQLPAQLAELERQADALKRSDNIDVLAELHSQLHKLAGSAGSLGQPALGAAARQLEMQVRNALQRQARPPMQKLTINISALVGYVQRSPEVAAPELPLGEHGEHGSGVWVLDSDQAHNRDLVSKLAPFNYDVRCFDKLQTLLDASQDEVPETIIVDIGFLAGKIRLGFDHLQNRGSQLLVISERDDFQQRVRAAHVGALGFQAKPLDILKLVARLEQGAARRKATPERVLIVDDDRPLAEHYRLTLELAGMRVEVLDRPENIIDTLNQLRPELVLMDLHMPRYSGPDLAGVIRQYDRWASLPIVYLSAETDLGLQVHALSRGADDFLTKPVKDAQLLVAVQARVQRGRELSAQITKDSLTGLLKHAAIKEAVEQELQRSRRTGQPMTLVMLDIDRFKSVNDSYGHATGDTVISAVAMLLNQRLRRSDVVGRYGGEEFLAVLPNCNLTDARILADEIRERFACVDFSAADGEHFCCTLSAGLACTTQHLTFESDALLAEADIALYGAKRSGRNRVCVAGECT